MRGGWLVLVLHGERILLAERYARLREAEETARRWRRTYRQVGLDLSRSRSYGLCASDKRGDVLLFEEQAFVVTIIVKDKDRTRARTEVARRLNRWFTEPPIKPPFPDGTLLYYSIQDSAWDYLEDSALSILEAALWTYYLTIRPDARNRDAEVARVLSRVSIERWRRAEQAHANIPA